MYIHILHRSNENLLFVFFSVGFDIMPGWQFAQVFSIGWKRIDQCMEKRLIHHPKILLIDLFRFLISKFINVGVKAGMSAFEKILTESQDIANRKNNNQ